MKIDIRMNKEIDPASLIDRIIEAFISQELINMELCGHKGKGYIVDTLLETRSINPIDNVIECSIQINMEEACDDRS